MKIVFVGSGNMASALIGGLINRGGSPGDIFAIDPDEVSRARVESQFGISTGEHVDSSIAQYDIVVLAVKPQAIRTICSSLAPHLTDQLIISIAASIRAIDISLWLAGYARIVRAMPNTPAFIGLGVTGLAALPGVDQTTKTLASAVMEKVGKVIWFEEEAAINAVTAVSGGGPAYVFYFIEAIEEAARQLGMSGDEARAVAVATFNGAVQLALHTGDSTPVLRERVTSKGGTTAAAIASFDAGRLKDTIVKGVVAANARAEEMSDSFRSL